MKKIILNLLFLCFFATTLIAQELNFYVSATGNDASGGTSPSAAFATLERAKQAVRQAKENNRNITSVNVYIKGGDYQLAQPLVFKPEDSGTENMQITWQAMPGEKVQISGGEKISGWKKGKNGIWQTSIPEVKEGKWYFQEIWVNGQTRLRARTPNEGFYYVKGFPEGTPKRYNSRTKSFEFAKGDLNPKWTNLKEVVVIVYHYWTDSHMPVESIDDKTSVVTFQCTDPKQFSDSFSEPWRGARYIVENVFEALDIPGEMYLDRVKGILYYMPFPEENMNTVEVIAPVTTEFITFEGVPDQQQYVQYITIKNIGFSNTLFVLPKDDTNGSSQSSSTVSACFPMKGARYCSFENCTINNIGTFAFDLGDGCTYNKFDHNTIKHLAGGGFRASGGAFGSNPLIRTGFNIFSDNTISYFGEIYSSAAGILLRHTMGNLVSHNLIDHGYQIGISVGWVWGYMPSISRDNIIEYNYIHHIGQGLLSDMGGIYTLGVSPGTIIRNNLIHDVESSDYGGWGIYMDEGSSHELVENNVVYNTKYSGFNIHYSKEVTVRNNIFALSRLELLQRQRVEPHQSVFFENNIMYWTRGKLLSADWVEPAYTFYYKAMDPKTREMNTNFTMDYNLYYNPNMPADSLRFGKQTLAEWNARGKDVHSLYTDPMFVDAAHFDFRLKPGSPAFRLGFKQIDMSTVGPRK